MVSEMHEILFKGQRKDNKKWIEGYLYQMDWRIFVSKSCESIYNTSAYGSTKDGLFVGEENTEFNAYVREVDPETICQYTGLIDNTKWEELFENEKQKFLSEWNRKEKRKNTKEDWNGRKIFENDFVSCRQYIGENHVDYCYECGYVEMKYGLLDCTENKDITDLLRIGWKVMNMK